MSNDTMNAALQENILTILCFHDDAAKIMRSYVEPDLFESSVYQEIATQAIDFLDKYKTTVKDHLADTISHILEKADDRKKQLYSNTLLNLYSYRDSVNIEYSLSQLNKFVRQQRLKQTLTNAVQNVQEGDLEQAETVLSNHLKSTIEVFDVGLNFRDIVSRFSKIFGQEAKPFEMGIGPLDDLGIGPNRKELFTILALPNKGKSWMMMHIAKFCALQKLKVLYVSLEMSENKLAARLLQSIFSVNSRAMENIVVTFKKDSLGRFMDMDFKKIKRPSLKDEDIEQFLMKKLEAMSKRLPIFIKQFPTASLTVRGLEAYLDILERQAGFIPDIICMDYADLMKIDTAMLRVDTGRIYKELRGLAVERNLAMVTASQSNRQGNKDKWITMDNFAEDFSKAGISDVVLSYNQTDAEYQLGLARLFLPKVRDSVKDVAVLISQAYGMGQFCLDSVKMEDTYWNQLKAHTKGEDDEE